MHVRSFAALAAVAAAIQLLQAAPALATSIATDRHSTDLVAQLLGDARLARLALIRNDAASANEKIYTELDANVALASDLMVPQRVPNETRAGHVKALETTYFAINLDKARTRLDAAQHAVRNNDDQAAEDALAAIRSDLVRGNDASDVPLLAARRELALAQGAINADDLGAASGDLEKASGALRSYSSVGHSAAAHQLASDIRSSMRVKYPRHLVRIDEDRRLAGIDKNLVRSRVVDSRR